MAVVGAVLATGLYLATRKDRVNADNIFGHESTSSQPDAIRHELPGLVAA